MSIKTFLSPKRIWFHLLLALGITVVIVVVALIFLNIFTHHGEEIEMPNFVGEDSEMLIQNANEHDFVIVISDMVFDQTTAEGCVLKQNPAAGEKVKKGRKVYLTIASSVPPKIKMPALKDVSLRQAEIMLKAVGLQLENIIYKPSKYENAVMEQLYKGRAIAPNTEIDMGEKITLVVGKSFENQSDNPSETDTENELDTF